MAIEFSCPKCDHLLRTADDKAGMSARCPACGESIWVPYESEPRPVAEDAPPEPADQPEAEPIPLHQPAGEDAFAGVPATAPIASDEESAPPPEPAVPEVPQGDINCPNCHAANEPTAPVCRFCGTSLEGVVPQPKPEWTPPRFDVSEIMSSAWRLYTQNIGLLIGCMLLMFLVMFAFELVVGIPIVIAFAALDEDALVIVIPILVIAFPLLLLFMAAMMIGQTNLYLRIVRGDTASVGDLFFGFAAGRRFIGRAFLIFLTAFAATLLGCVLCIAPGVIVMLIWWPALPMLLDKDLPGGEIISRTIEFIKQEFGSVIAIGAIATGIQMLAQFVPYVGIILQLFAIPFAQLLLMFAYLRITQQFTAVDRMAGH